MIKTLVYTFLLSLAICVILAKIFIPLLRKLRAGQPILSYLSEHSVKSGTPTMGGLFIVIAFSIAYLVFFYKGNIASLVALFVVLCYMTIGFLDDFIKIRFCRNEGLTPTQKIIFQIAVALISSIFIYNYGLTKCYIPFTKTLIDIDWWIIPLATITFLATTNCVNLTDGLDGLAGSVTKYVSIFCTLLILLQINSNSSVYINQYEYKNFAIFSIAIAGALEGFLMFNTYKASVFMGDTGSLALGGAVASIMIFSGNVFYIPILGITFVLSGISVIVQVVAFKKTGKRVFLIAPFHHHLEHKGLSESKIVALYCIITVIVSLPTLLAYAV